MHFSKKVTVYNGVWGKAPKLGMIENFCVKILTVSYRTRCLAIAGTTARCVANFGTYRTLQWHRAVFTAIATLWN